ncbi:AraC family transcriptional regulator [Mycobacterium paraffinicum]|uniref:HTH-type transcriptional regulator RipA n=1 Tax=Mycobacterium paraffinicum TaxID=53378 RepID=A0A1Q4H999_9MYCO|nr:helix-turn-helix transcriptional regulator [Mycobacterium paraffinicum]OJZ64118.1 AraC family transcriptional regulator [Mycobacterium paraffinicum]
MDPQLLTSHPHLVPREANAAAMRIVMDDFRYPPHRHHKAELVFVASGVFTCEVDRDLWIVPPQCGLWIPSDLEHSAHGEGDIAVYVLFVEPDVLPQLPNSACTVSVSPLLRELIVTASQLPQLYRRGSAEERLIRTTLDQLAAAPVENLRVPMPGDPRLRTIAKALLDNPAERRTIGQWARQVAMSERSLFRLVQSETGMSFGRWRQQFQLMLALQRLSQGAQVHSVASDLGYETDSAFITMFRNALGESPAQFFARRRARVRHSDNSFPMSL